MKIKKNTSQSYLNINRFKEYQKSTHKINNITMFSYGNIYLLANFYSIILNFSLKNVGFNKKKALSFFLGIEYLTNQKCIATLSSKNILEWKLRKGALVGCKVTLRKKNLYEFLDILTLSLARMEKFTGVQLKNNKKNITNTLGIKLVELILFYPIELGLGINSDVKQMDIYFLFNVFNLEEKLFLLKSKRIPIEN